MSPVCLARRAGPQTYLASSGQLWPVECQSQLGNLGTARTVNRAPGHPLSWRVYGRREAEPERKAAYEGPSQFPHSSGRDHAGDSSIGELELNPRVCICMLVARAGSARSNVVVVVIIIIIITRLLSRICWWFLRISYRGASHGRNGQSK